MTLWVRVLTSQAWRSHFQSLDTMERLGCGTNICSSRAPRLETETGEYPVCVSTTLMYTAEKQQSGPVSNELEVRLNTECVLGPPQRNTHMGILLLV